MKNLKNKNKGFSLIETLIYIGIFTLIMASAVISIYSIIGANARNQAKAMVGEEGAFLIGKIDWALTGIKNSSVNADNNKLTVNKFDSNIDNPIVIEIIGDNLTIKRGVGVSDPLILNNDNIKISCPSKCFERVGSNSDGINPESISANIRVSTKTSDGLSYYQDFYTIKYIRK